MDRTNLLIILAALIVVSITIVTVVWIHSDMQKDFAAKGLQQCFVNVEGVNTAVWQKTCYSFE
jgi:preprotein translocase subunit SecG